MQNKSLGNRVSLPFELLKTFSEKELNHFEKLINSGYLSEKQGLNLLLKSLKKYALNYTEFTPELQVIIYKSLYKQEETDIALNDKQKKKLSKAMNDLLALAEKFLMFERIKNTDEHDSTFLFPELIDRKQTLLYSRRIKATEKKLNKEKKQGVEYHNQCYYIQKEKARLLFMNNALAKEDNYDELQYHADLKYLLQKLQYHLAKITLQRRYAQKTFKLKPIEALKTLLGLSEYQTNPLIQLYLLNIQLVETEQEATFLALSKLLKEKQEVIPTDSLKPFYVNLTNYCTFQVAKGDLKYYKYLFEIYSNMHEGKLLVHDKLIELGLLKNIITTACRVDAFDWAAEKLSIYIKYVPAAIRNAVFQYHNGIMAFNQQKYEVALSHLIQVKKIDDTHELNLRIVQLQCFYETDAVYETGTQQMIDSLKTYIHQNKRLTKRQKAAYFNFIRIFNKLYQFKDVPDNRSLQMELKKALPKTKERLLKFDFIKEKRWLLDKIKILEDSGLVANLEGSLYN